MKMKTVAKAVILNELGQVLLLRRSETDDRRPGEQDFPGGGVEPGEDLAAAVSREIFEEAGLHVPVQDLQLAYARTELYGPTQQYSRESVTRLLFLARVTAAVVKLSYEHDDFHWVSPQTAIREFPHPFYGSGLAYMLKYEILPLVSAE
jgi:8-oxo-dGTP pyrophosphatase MutT (NUDIX family)